MNILERFAVNCQEKVGCSSILSEFQTLFANNKNTTMYLPCFAASERCLEIKGRTGDVTFTVGAACSLMSSGRCASSWNLLGCNLMCLLWEGNVMESDTIQRDNSR